MKSNIWALIFLALPFATMASEEGNSLRALKRKGKKPNCEVAKMMKKYKDDRMLKKKLKKSEKTYFNRVSVFPICAQIDAACNTDEETVAEIVVATADGMTLVYSDSEQEQVGFVDISDPSDPQPAGVVALSGEPSSVAIKGSYALVGINTSNDYVDASGQLVAISLDTKTIVATWELGGQPDSVAVSPDETFAVIAIENERDEDLGDGEPPQMPAGFVVVVDVSSAATTDWSMSTVNVTGLDGLVFPEDPEPEFIAINQFNLAVVTLQENNGIVLIDLPSLEVVDSFSAGSVNLNNVDIEEEGIISPDGSLTAVPREPDGVTFLDRYYFATADEGDLFGGSRGFTIFDVCGDVAYSSGNKMEHIAIQHGHYPDERSENKGNEPENIAFGTFDDTDFLFVNSERSNLVFVYDVSSIKKPEFLQVLPAGVGPEGSYAIPERNLLVVASEKDDRGDKMRSVINIYEYGADEAQYPSLKSATVKGKPIGWGALSGLAGGDKDTLYAVEDSFYKANRFFTIDTSEYPAIITSATTLIDSNDVLSSISPYGDFSAEDLEALVNDDKTVNIDPEGIAYTGDAVWIAHEGRGTIGDADRPIESLNMLIKADMDGVILDVITLPDAWNDKQVRYGFEGVAYDPKNECLVVTIQRAWGTDTDPAIHIYDLVSMDWVGYVYYPLDTPESQDGGWVGLGDISYLGDMKFLVLERDNQGGPDAAIKKVYGIDLNGWVDGSTISKVLVRDLIGDYEELNGLMFEKVEGLAFTDSGMFVVNDNDGVDDNNGETQLLNIEAKDIIIGFI